MKLCFATNNKHKIQEVTAMLGLKYPLLALSDIGCEEELSETEETLTGNAHQKAWYVWTRYHVPCFADDTGLEVASLSGAPGVYSARYAGPKRESEENISLLLKNLEDVTEREAQFRTVISLVLPDGEWFFEGVVRGTILRARRGAGGFGYDPVFLPDNADRTLAEMTLEEKNLVSHRGLAIGKLAEFLGTRGV